MEKHELLRNVSLFADLSVSHLKTLAKSCKERSFAAGETIVRQGNPGIGLFVLTRGRVHVRKTNEDGSEFTVAEHGPGEVVGEMSVIDGAPRSASVVAVDDTEALVLPSWAFNSFLEAHPQVALHILPIVVRRFRETNDALLHLRAQQGDQ